MTVPAWVGLSGAVPDLDDLQRHGWSELDLRFMVARIAERVLERGWGLVHGNHPTYRPIVERVARGFGGGTPRVRIVASRWFIDQPGEDARFLERHAGAEVELTDRGVDRPTSLTRMRERLIERSDALVCIGGRLHTGRNKRPGVEEEVDLALGHALPVFLLGGFGGFAQQYFDQAFATDPSKLRNPLGDEQNRRLARSTDPVVVLELLLEGLAAALGPRP